MVLVVLGPVVTKWTINLHFHLKVKRVLPSRTSARVHQRLVD